MRKYENQKERQIQEILCNCCGRKIRIEKGMVMEGVFHGQVQWGYFSEKASSIPLNADAMSWSEQYSGEKLSVDITHCSLGILLMSSFFHISQSVISNKLSEWSTSELTLSG